MSTRIEREHRETTASIAASAANSSSVAVGSSAWGSYQIPSAFTGATVTVQYSNDGTNFTAVHNDSGAAVSAQTVSANGTYSIPNNAFKAKFIRFVSASNEAAARTITVVMKG